MKKFLSLVLALVLTMSLVVVPANATVTVSLDETNITLNRGEKKTLTATVAANDGKAETVTWESSAETVATVDENGEVTAVAKGTATITATSTADSTKSASCSVKVNDKLLSGDIASVTINGRTYSRSNGTVTVYMVNGEDITPPASATTTNGRGEINSVTLSADDKLTLTEKNTNLTCEIPVTRLDTSLTVSAPAKLVQGGKASLSATYRGSSKTTYEWTYKVNNGTPQNIGRGKNIDWTPNGLEAGTYTITCTAKEGEAPAATGPAYIEIVAENFAFTTNTGITTLKKGDHVDRADYADFTEIDKTKTLYSSLTNVSYKSSDTSVITVDNNGRVTAVDDGTADVTIEGTYLGKKYSSDKVKFSVVSMSAELGSVINGDYERFSSSDIEEAIIEAVNKVVSTVNEIDEGDIDKINVTRIPDSSKATLYNDDYDEDNKITASKNRDITNSDLYIEAEAGVLGTVSFDVTVDVGSKSYVVTLKFDSEAAGKIELTVSGEEDGSKVTFDFPNDYDYWYVYEGSGSFKDSMYSNYLSSSSGWKKYKAGASCSLNSSKFDDGSVTLYVVGIAEDEDEDDVASTGELEVVLDSYDIEYSGTAGTTITFDQDDFEDMLQEAAEDAKLIGKSKKNSTAYVEFDHVTFSPLPKTNSEGVLYNDGEQIKSSSKASVKECTDLDKVTFEIANKADSQVYIKFTVTADYYKDDKRNTEAKPKDFSGRVVVKVVHEDIKYTVPVDGSVVFKAEDFQDFFDDTYKKSTLSYVKFTEMPKVTDGMLYATYSAIYAGTVAEESDKFYYDSKKVSDYDLDDVTFRTSLWSKAGTKVYIPFTAYGTKSSQSVDGWVVITVENARTMNFTDVKTSDWFYNNVKNAYSMGLIEGKTATTFNPNDNMTYAEAVTLAARMHQLSKTGKVTLSNSTTGNWYSNYESYAISNGIISSALGDKANKMITRKDYVDIFYNALPSSNYAVKNTVTKIPDLTENSTNAKVYGFYRAGILTGYSNTPGKVEHAFGPNDNIKRSEVATILIRMMDASTRVYFYI